ncbi:SDR family oxidoreductase [Bacteroides sp.]
MKTIFITGASSGIGKATSILFAQKGWRVISTMRNPEKGKDLLAYKNIEIRPLDVTNPNQINETIEEVLKQHEVDVLFNNAGYGMKTRFEDMTEESMKKSLDTNVLGMIRVTQKFIPYFKKRKSGLVLTTTSIAGEMGLVLDGIYAADKWAVTGLCEMLYSELAPYDIQVKTLVPGVVKTGFVMEMSPMDGYEQMIQNQMNLLMPDSEDLETAQEVAEDVWNIVNDTDKDRMCYVTGKVAQQLYNLRQEMGAEAFRKHIKALLCKQN